MAINKVVYGDQTLVDLTSDTATAEDVAQGKTFHDASGQQRTGSNTGSGGHIIQNASGTDLAQEPKLQFGGMLKATDDATNGVTKVSDLAEEVDWSTWNAMTEAQRTAYSTGKKLDIVNVPSVSGSIPVELIKTLWTNPDPSATFAAQSITLPNDDYDFLLILANFSNTVTDTQATAILAKSQGTYLNGSHTGGSAFGVARRWIKHDSDTSLIVEDAYSATSSSAAQTITNGRIIPVAVYGLKSSVNVDMSALVANVSTSASKCMLSDGETSVEDALTVNNLQPYISIASYTESNPYVCPCDGYFSVSCASGGSITGRVSSATNAISFITGATIGGIPSAVFVKKGMRINVRSSSGTTYAEFYPLEV